jgi:hypothetical protein
MKQTWPIPRRHESTNASSGLPSARADQPAIVPSIALKPAEPPLEVLAESALIRTRAPLPSRDYR